MTRPALILHNETEGDQLRLSVTAHPVVNLALVHNNVPLVQQIEIRNEGPGSLTDLHISAELLATHRSSAP